MQCCDACARFWDDASASVAHAIECGCDWEALEGFRDERVEGGPLMRFGGLTQHGLLVRLRGEDGTEGLLPTGTFYENFSPVFRAPSGR